MTRMSHARLALALMAALAMLLADLRPGPNGAPGLSVAWADDDDDGDDDVGGDDDDDDDDDGAAPRPRRVAPPAPVTRPPAQRPVSRPAAPPRFAPDEVVARGLSAADRQALRAAGFRELRERRLSGGDTLLRLRKPARLSLQQARAAVRARGAGTSADLNHYYRPGAGADCSGADCPLRQMIDWPRDTAGCGTPPRIGMVDTGLNARHPVLSEARLHLHRLERGPAQPASDALHGTSVAALLVGAPDSRIPGLVPQATLIAVDAFYKRNGDERADVFALIEALDHLAARDVDVINLSLAGPHNTLLAQQIRRLDRQGIVLVAAAGNGGPAARPAYPAAFDPVIAVTAVDRRGQVYRRAVRGAHIDLAAPGVEVWTAASIRGARTRTGTSYAAPFVTAAAALILQRDPDLTPAQVRARLTGGARDLGRAGPDEIFGHGLLLPMHPCG